MDDDLADSGAGTLSLDPVVHEALERFNRCVEWEGTARDRFVNDVKFRHGDSDNSYQWPNAIFRNRETQSKPCLTINQIRQHNLMIVNEAKKNKSSVAIKPVGGNATAEAAQIYSAIMRRIEYQSNAQDAYSGAIEFQVDGGIGFWRLKTDWAGPDSFDQEIYIEGISDPLSVYLDPDAKEKDKSDSKFGFIFDDMPKKEFADAYPKYKDKASLAPLGSYSERASWVDAKMVRVCEYFRLVFKQDELLEFYNREQRKRFTIRKSLVPPDVWEEVIKDPLSRTRDVFDKVVEWKLIVGEEVVDETDWPGSYIPIIPVIGEETVIEGTLDRKGHTRALKDAQRMYNYNASSQVEFVAMQGKTPWIAAAKAIEEYEVYWNTANTDNHSVLPWNHMDDDGNPVPPPFRGQPPSASPAYQQGMDTAFNQLMMASGQWQNQMGMMGNERTGAAIGKRQEQSETSVYHFQDNYARALRATGKQIIELIPLIYNSNRTMMVMAEDGSDFELQIDPSAKQAYAEQLDRQGKIIKRVLNPRIGQYDVEAGVGPAYGTRREETVQALTLILTQNPGLTGIVGDLLLQAMDFKEAQEAALRLKRMVPPQALGKGPTQQEQLLQQQIGALQTALAKSLERQAKDHLKLVGKGEMRDIDVYNAETARFKALADSLMADEAGIGNVVHMLVQDALQTHLEPILKANSKDVGEEEDGGDDGSLGLMDSPPMPGARKAPDGQWYLSDPTRRGRYLRIAPLAQEHASPRA